MGEIGLSEETRATLHALFAKFPQIEKVLIYESEAKDNYAPFSDVDMALIGTMLNSEILTKVILQIEDLMLPYNFNISIYDKTHNTEIVEQNDRTSKVLYCPEQILIFGGTTEGRKAAMLCGQALKPFFYSTKSGDQTVHAPNLCAVSGGMEAEEIATFCQTNSVRLIIDASHPFAANLHNNIDTAATAQLKIPTIRYERLSKMDPSVITCSSLEEAIDKVSRISYSKIIALTGVNSAKRLLPLVKHCNVYLRMMDRPSSWGIIEDLAFPKENIILYNETEAERRELELEQILTSQDSERIRAALIIKESGEAGGFREKVALAKRLGIDLYVISRPTLPAYTSTVYGEYGLRREIERLLPRFFPLRTGFTTGTAATAATIAALKTSLEKKAPKEVEVFLPNGEPIRIKVDKVSQSANAITATVLKEAGDDPDVTNGLEICSTVTFNTLTNNIQITGGEGVGIVTLPGLGIAIGESAINEVPRKMIADNALRITEELGYAAGIKIVISVPKGRDIARSTFNGRLGIEGGISILGTSGIVQPFSHEAFLDSIRRQIKIIKALGHRCVVMNSGAKSENYIKGKYKNLPKELFLHYGNAIGDTLTICQEEGIEQVILGVMIGKAAKLAAGDLDTHSKKSTLNKEFLLRVAGECGCNEEDKKNIKEMTVARELWQLVPKQSFFERLRACCYETCCTVYNIGTLKIELIK